MSKVSIYLNFPGNAEEAFNFYKSVFKTEFAIPIMYMKMFPQVLVCRLYPKMNKEW